MEIDIEKTKKLLLDWKKAVFESRWCAEEDAVSALGRERDQLRHQLQEAHAALGQLADRVRQLASSYAALAPVIETKNRTSKELQALKEAQREQEEAHRRALAEAVSEAEAARTEGRRLVQEAERRGREAECAVRAECAEQLRAVEERLCSERNERAAEERRHQERTRDLEQQHYARVQQLQRKVSSLHNAAAQRSAAGGEVYAAKLDGARRDFAVQLADRDSRLCELRRQLQHCEDQLRRQRVLTVVRGEVTPSQGRREGDGADDDAVNVDVCVDRVCGDLDSRANCQGGDVTAGQPPNKRHRSNDHDEVDAGSADVSCDEAVRDGDCSDADVCRTDDVAPQRQQTSLTNFNVGFTLTSVESSEKSPSQDSICSEYREASASNAVVTPASDHQSNGHFLDDTCDGGGDMRGLARAWQRTDHTLAEKFRAITKLLAGEKEDAEPKIADENGDSVFTGSEGFIVGNVYDDEYGREDLDKENNEEDCHPQASVADGISTENDLKTVTHLCGSIPSSDASVTAVTETPRKAWQFSSRINDGNNRRHFRRDRSVDYRNFVTSSGPSCRLTASECVFDQSEQSASRTCHISEQNDALVAAKLIENDEPIGCVAVPAQKTWLPHNRTQPAVKSYPTESEPLPDYGELFDNALDSSFPCPRKLAAKMADPSKSSRSIHESDTTSYDIDDIPRRPLQYCDKTLDNRDVTLGRLVHANDTVFCDTLYNSNALNISLQDSEMTVNSDSTDVVGNKKNNKRKLFSGDTFL